MTQYERHRKKIEPPQEAEVVKKLTERLLGQSLVALYLYGSAIFGRLGKFSDLDFLAIVKDDIPSSVIEDMSRFLMEISGQIGNPEGKRPLELIVVKYSDITPWLYPPKSIYQYGEPLRKNFEAGWRPKTQDDPDLTVILCQTREWSLTLIGPDADKILPSIPKEDLREAIRQCLPGVLNHLKGQEPNSLLTLARMWATVETGRFYTKEEAAKWARERLSQEQGHLLYLAQLAYRGEREDDWSKIYEQSNILAQILSKKIFSQSCPR
ncbi:MAG: DUF4111 domain-containing protein [Deltaproteobacteria bacterium]|jgi:streptomycin 3"-adenylyltransferase|nr:DUF4111 domain-containing protein [Deltaproteobacteria bacterium]